VCGVVGTVRDGAGRPGTAVAIDNVCAKERDVLIFGPCAVALLGKEQTTLPGYREHYEAGTRIASATYLRSGRRSIRQRP
jgi:hypothetical protein